MSFHTSALKGGVLLLTVDVEFTDEQMDLGVGAIVYSGGIVGGFKSKHQTTSEPLFKRLQSSVKIALPALIIGIGRMVIVKALNYQVRN